MSKPPTVAGFIELGKSLRRTSRAVADMRNRQDPGGWLYEGDPEPSPEEIQAQGEADLAAWLKRNQGESPKGEG